VPSGRGALVVAVGQYQDPGLRRLRAPAHDAEALREVLADPAVGGFDVELVVDGTEAQMRRQVWAFFNGRRTDDTLLVHFSCHGVKDDSGELYFAARDTELGALDVTALPAEFVRQQMTKSRSRRIVLLLDCCYSGAFSRGWRHRGSQGMDLQERFQGRGHAVLTASSAMEYAFEGATLTKDDASPSVFTSALVQGLRTGAADIDGDGTISVDELYRYLHDEVQQQTPGQTPLMWNLGMEGEFVIARTPQARAVDLPDELQAALASPLPGARLDSIPALKQLLQGRHRGLAVAARLALERLRDEDDSQRVRRTAAEALDGATLVMPPSGPAAPILRPAEVAGSPAKVTEPAVSSPEPPRAEGRVSESAGPAGPKKRSGRWLVIAALVAALTAGGVVAWWSPWTRGQPGQQGQQGQQGGPQEGVPICPPTTGEGWSPIDLGTAPTGRYTLEEGGSLAFTVKKAYARARDGKWQVSLETAMENATPGAAYHYDSRYDYLVVGQRAFPVTCFRPTPNLVSSKTVGDAVVGFDVTCEPVGYIELALEEERARISVTDNTLEPGPC
jgi:uncharacterized caspase-like protein